jgi:hypothetical protein
MARPVTLKLLSIEKPPRITMDPEAWQEGFNAGRRGPPQNNPFPHRSDEALAWISGYIEGKAKPLRSVKDER